MLTIQIIPIELPLPFHMGSVNCYLLRQGSSNLLIDTGSSSARKTLSVALEKAGCTPENLKLIVLTHGDFDHSGNAAWLHTSFKVQLAVHAGDAGMVERGDMFINRKQPSWFIRKLIPLLTGFGKWEHFVPDLLLEDGIDLSRHGFYAKVISIPGHSKGSIGILTTEGDLFCGDLFENLTKPKLNSIMDDIEDAQKSLETLRKLKIKTIFPGHGKPFHLNEILQ